MSNEWLQNLKPGDAVCVQTQYGTTEDVVERTTATQIILSRTRRYKKDGGYLIGGPTYGGSWLVPATEQRLDAIRTRQKNRKLKQQIINTINTATVDQLERVVAILSEDK